MESRIGERNKRRKMKFMSQLNNKNEIDHLFYSFYLLLFPFHSFSVLPFLPTKHVPKYLRFSKRSNSKEHH